MLFFQLRIHGLWPASLRRAAPIDNFTCDTDCILVRASGQYTAKVHQPCPASIGLARDTLCSLAIPFFLHLLYPAIHSAPYFPTTNSFGNPEPLLPLASQPRHIKKDGLCDIDCYCGNSFTDTVFRLCQIPEISTPFIVKCSLPHCGHPERWTILFVFRWKPHLARSMFVSFSGIDSMLLGGLTTSTH